MVSPLAKKRRDIMKSKFKVMGDHDEFLRRIKKSLYYGKLPETERFSLPLSELSAELFTNVKCRRGLDRLDLEGAADFSRNACVSPCSLVLALLYLDRLKSSNIEYLQRVAPTELFLVSMMIASKFLHDDGEEDEVFNDEWATSAGIDIQDLNQFERNFLRAIDWEVFVREKDFWSKLHEIERDIALREGKKRGWFSYTDLDNLFELSDLKNIAQLIITVSAVCLTSYAASVLTLIGSALIVSHIPGSALSRSTSQTTVPNATHPSPNINNTSGLPENVTFDELQDNLIFDSLQSYRETNCIYNCTDLENKNKTLAWMNDFGSRNFSRCSKWNCLYRHGYSVPEEFGLTDYNYSSIRQRDYDISMVDLFSSDRGKVWKDYLPDLSVLNQTTEETTKWLYILLQWIDHIFSRHQELPYIPQLQVSHY